MLKFTKIWASRKTFCSDLKTKRFCKQIALHALSSIGAISTVLAILRIGWPDQTPFTGVGWAIGYFIVSAIYAIFRSWPRPIEVHLNKPNTTIKIIEGNIFDQEHNLSIGTCDTFDTLPPDIIASTSLQAQTLSELFEDDVQRLDSLLNAELAHVSSIGTIDKLGKTDKYEIGTTVSVPHGERRIFFVAYTEMDASNVARASVDGIWTSLDKLWIQVTERGNGYPLAMPVIGGGQARISQLLPAQDAIRLIVLSFIFASRKERVCSELVIVVREGDYQKLDRLELQAFLQSLRES